MDKKTSVNIRCEEDRCFAKSPYHPDLPKRAKQLGGVWRGSDKVWIFDARDEEQVRELYRDIYGTDGQPVPTRTILHTVTHGESQESSLFLYGRQVVRKYSRDQAPSMGQGVVVVEGKFPNRGGSRRYPKMGGEGTVLKIRDVPATFDLEEGDEVVQEESDKPQSQTITFINGDLALLERVMEMTEDTPQEAVMHALGHYLKHQEAEQRRREVEAGITRSRTIEQ